MKITHILLAAVLLLCSCSTKSSAPTSKDVCGTDVYGDGDGIISIVSDNYTLTKKDGRLRLKIRLKLEESVDEKVSAYPKIILKDEDGVELISSWNQMEMSSSEKSNSIVSLGVRREPLKNLYSSMSSVPTILRMH